MVKRIVKRAFFLAEEGEPVWMWSLKSLYVRHFFVLKRTTIRFLDTFKTKFSNNLKMIGISNVYFVSFSNLSNVPSSCTLLASGSLTFLKYSAMTAKFRGSWVLNTSWKRRGLPWSTHGVKWIRSSAEDFGCPVKFELLMGSRGDQVDLPKTELRRFIRHFLNYRIIFSVRFYL